MDHDHTDAKIAATFGISGVLMSLVVITAAAAFSTFKWKQRHLEKAAAKFPGPPALPIIGNALKFWGKPEDVFEKLSEGVNQYGHILRFWLGPVLVVAVHKPEDIEIVLNSRHTLEKASLYKFLKKVLGNGLFTAPVEKWRKHRRAIQPVFNRRLLEQFIPVFNRHSSHLVDKLKLNVNGNQFDIWNYIALSTLGIICETTLGIDENTLPHFKSEFSEATHLLLKLIMMRCFKFWMQSDFIFYTYVKLKYGFDIMEKLTEKTLRLPQTIIKKKKEEYECKKEKESLVKNKEYNAKSDSKSKVFIDILLELSYAGVNFSDDDLLNEVVTIIVAGYDTAAQTDCFCVLMLAIHQDIQEKVYKEMFEIFGDSDRDATIEDLKQMFYTEMVIKETMRIFPTAPIFGRTVTQDIDLTDHKLPAGCTVVISPLGIHRDPKVFPNPMKFNPENFTPENNAERHAYSYIPFSAGPRNCIGSFFAMLSMKTTISTLVRNYRFYTDIKMEDVKLRTDILLRSTIGYPVRIVKRK